MSRFRTSGDTQGRSCMSSSSAKRWHEVKVGISRVVLEEPLVSGHVGRVRQKGPIVGTQLWLLTIDEVHGEHPLQYLRRLLSKPLCNCTLEAVGRLQDSMKTACTL